MSAPQPQVSPENFNVYRDALDEEDPIVVREALPAREPTHMEAGLPPGLARRVVKDAVLLASLTQPMRSRLTVAGKDGAASVDLPLRIDTGAAPGFRIETPDSAGGITFVLDARTDGRGTLRYDVRYIGLPLERALSYARFVRALYWEEGTLSLTRLAPTEVRVDLVGLPLTLDSVGKEEAENRLRLLEALDEVSRMTGTDFVYPTEIDDEDVRNLNHVLKAIHGGWVALHVTDFTTPMGPEGVRNILDVVAEEGEVLRALAMKSEGERAKTFDSWVDLGPSVRYVSGARLATPRSELEEWLASERSEDDSFEVRWTPEDDALVHVFYDEWPKPSLDVARRNIEAFEEEYGMTSEDFRRAWESGEPEVRAIEDGDIWISFLGAREALGPST